jgi:hypothetical protein
MISIRSLNPDASPTASRRPLGAGGYLRVIGGKTWSIARLKVISAILCTVALFSTEFAMGKSPLPPIPEEVVGSWQGYSDDGLEFDRLELDPDGTGLLAISYLPNAPSLLYRVESWVIRGGVIELTLAQIDKAAELVKMSPALLGVDALEVTLHGAGWSRQLVLFNERVSEMRATEAKARIRQYRETH